MKEANIWLGCGTRGWLNSCLVLKIITKCKRLVGGLAPLVQPSVISAFVLQTVWWEQGWVSVLEQEERKDSEEMGKSGKAGREEKERENIIQERKGREESRKGRMICGNRVLYLNRKIMKLIGLAALRFCQDIFPILNPASAALSLSKEFSRHCISSY